MLVFGSGKASLGTISSNSLALGGRERMRGMTKVAVDQLGVFDSLFIPGALTDTSHAAMLGFIEH